MLQININETFYNITQAYPNLKDVLIELGFKPMANMQTYQTVGRVITLKKALQHIGLSPDQAQKILNEKGLEVTFYE